MHLVIGGTGNVGRQVVSGLLGEHVDVRVFSRSPQRHPGWDGVDLVAGDLSSAVGLDEALDGVETVFLLWPLFDSSHAARVVTAIAARARRVVYLSSVAVRDDLEIQRHSYSAFHREIERLIAESGVE